MGSMNTESVTLHGPSLYSEALESQAAFEDDLAGVAVGIDVARQKKAKVRETRLTLAQRRKALMRKCRDRGVTTAAALMAK